VKALLDILSINQQLSKLDDGGKSLKFLDIGIDWGDQNGDILAEIMPDALHPDAKGYQIWIGAMGPKIEGLIE
jgi:beta-glucosidase